LAGHHNPRAKTTYVLAKAVVDDSMIELQVPPAEALLGDGLAAALGADAAVVAELNPVVERDSRGAASLSESTATLAR